MRKFELQEHGFSRRAFLAGAATGLVCAASPSSRVAAASERVRIGIVGGDAETRRALGGFRRAAQSGHASQLVAAAAVEGDFAFPSGWGLRVYSRWQEVVESADVDGVIVATPVMWRASVALAAIEAGKDVYILSPMALLASEALAIGRAASERRRIVQVDAERCGHPAWDHVRKQVDGGELGPLRRGSVRFFQGGEPNTLTRQFYDAIAPLLFATNRDLPDRVSAVGGRSDGDCCKDPETIMMTAEYGRGTPDAFVMTATSSSADIFQATIRGERSTARIGGATEPAALGSENVLVEEWIAAIRSREACRCDAALGYRTMAIAEAAVESHKQGRVIELGASA